MPVPNFYSIPYLEIVSNRHRAIDAEELVFHLRIAVAYDRYVVLKIEYQLAAGIETIERRFTAA